MAGKSEPAPSLEARMPRHLAERVLRSRAALEGERKQVTVLFADVKGSLALIEYADPEDARRILDAALGVMMDGVHRYEGTVNRVLGDGIMALFGAPIAHEDHAVRACFAALAIQRAMRIQAAELRGARGVELSARIGLGLTLTSESVGLDFEWRSWPEPAPRLPSAGAGGCRSRG